MTSSLIKKGMLWCLLASVVAAMDDAASAATAGMQFSAQQPGVPAQRSVPQPDGQLSVLTREQKVAKWTKEFRDNPKFQSVHGIESQFREYAFDDTDKFGVDKFLTMLEGFVIYTEEIAARRETQS